MGGLWSTARRGTETGAHARVGTKRPRPSWRPVAPVDRQKVPVSVPSATAREAGDGQRDAKRARRSEFAVRTGPGSVPVVSAQPAEEPVMSSIDPTPDGGTHRYKVRCPALYWGNKKEVTRVLKRVKEFPPYQSVHKISKWDHFFISFPNAAAAADGVAKLALIYHKGDPWTASKVSAHTPRQIRVTAAMQQATKDGNTDKNGVCRTAADVTAPWRAVPYEEQLSRKRKLLDSALADITTAVWGERFAGGAVPWADALQSDRRRRDVPPCCDLESVFGAEGDLEDARSYYRNKNEFTIGFSPSSCGVGHTHHVREPTAGYSLGLVSTGEVRIGAITEDCISTSAISRQVATTMSDIVVRSKQTIYDKMAHVGYWRQVMCRHSDRTGTVIIVPMVSSRVQDDEGNIAPPEDAWSDERCREETWIAMQKLFEGTPYKIGLFWQVCDSLTAQSAETLVERLNGIEWLEEELMGLTFRVHPAAFFQVNTRMAERLYQTIGELGCLQESSVLLDICCGTGTIGLCLASRVYRVVGIEMCEPAILDARVNASRNGVTNSIFIAGRVEDKIRELLAHVPTSRECIAILDPPRAGVHSSVIIALRAVKAINRIVYVACEPKNLHRNALALCRPKSKVYGGVPFRPVRAVGVDLFPHTPCAELVVQFER